MWRKRSLSSSKLPEPYTRAIYLSPVQVQLVSHIPFHRVIAGNDLNAMDTETTPGTLRRRRFCTLIRGGASPGRLVRVVTTRLDCFVLFPKDRSSNSKENDLSQADGHVLKEFSVPTQLVIYADEGHSLFKPADRTHLTLRGSNSFKKYIGAQ